MRRTALTCLGFATLALAAIIPACGETPSGEHVIRAAQPIQGGTVDQGDSAVVSILINSSQGMSLCSGSLIGPNLVLSAHHCVANPGSTACSSNSFGATSPASDFRVTTSYNAAAAIFNGGNPSLPAADGVTWFAVSSVSVPGNNICGQDMSALTLTQSVSGICPLIPAVDTAVTSGEGYTAIGFGITSPSGQTAGTRYKVTGMSVTCASNCSPGQDSPTMEWEGGASSAKGTCEGDSGGPAIDASGRVIGTVSRGPAGACNSTVYESVYGEAAWIKQVAQAAASAGGYAAAGWVSGAATSSPTSGYCGGSSSSSSSSSSTSTSSSSSSGGSSGGVPTSCTGADGGIGCCTSTGVLYYCSSTNKLTHQTCAAGTVCGWNAAGPYYDCVPAPGGADPSNMYPLLCGGTTSSSSSSSTSTSTSSSGTTSSSSSSGGTNCGFQDPTPACDSCLTSMCCAQEQACANDATCVQCVTSATPPAGCSSNQAYNDFGTCYSTTCATPCGGGSSSSSSGTTSSGTTSSSGSASSSGGTGGSSSGGASSSSGIFGGGGSGTGGANGNGNSGTGNAFGGVGHGPGASSGCNVASSGGAPASPASLAGLLLGAALLVSRRRR